MRRTMMKSKVHRATVTAADLDYEGSIAIDPALLEGANILPGEQVHVYDVDNGARLVTYAIEAAPGSGDVMINGAAARLVHAGDTVLIVSYAEYEDEEARSHSPVVVHVDERNRIRPAVVPAGA